MNEDGRNPENLPIAALPEVPCVGPNNSLNDIQMADAIRAEVMLQKMYSELSQPMSIQSLCKLSTAMGKMMEVRRHLLNRPYGVANKGKDDGIVDALD